MSKLTCFCLGACTVLLPIVIFQLSVALHQCARNLFP